MPTTLEVSEEPSTTGTPRSMSASHLRYHPQQQAFDPLNYPPDPHHTYFQADGRGTQPAASPPAVSVPHHDGKAFDGGNIKVIFIPS